MRARKVTTEELYFDWLLDRIKKDGLPDPYCYAILLEEMLHEEFYWKLAKDENRAVDGLSIMRQVFVNTEGYDDILELNDGRCSVLEMFMALAQRCENDIMSDDPEENNTSLWFWKMMENMGLLDLDDDHFSYERYSRIMERFLERTYERDGFGGPFYCPNVTKDMRQTELWYQMNTYLECQFPVIL